MPQDVPHFQEAGRLHPTHPEARMPEAVYSTALDYLVFACVDLVFTHKNDVLLAKRNAYPRASWWIIGGRMAAGEHPKDTAARKACQEANLQGVEVDRYRYVGVYSTCFARRQQPPERHGSHSLNLTYQVELTLAEKQQLTLRSDEYELWRWLSLEQAITLLGTDDSLDHALLTVIQDALSLSR